MSGAPLVMFHWSVASVLPRSLHAAPSPSHSKCCSDCAPYGVGSHRLPAGCCQVAEGSLLGTVCGFASYSFQTPARPLPPPASGHGAPWQGRWAGTKATRGSRVVHPRGLVSNWWHCVTHSLVGQPVPWCAGSCVGTSQGALTQGGWSRAGREHSQGNGRSVSGAPHGSFAVSAGLP